MRAENSAGIVGAVISHLLLWSIGWSAYVLVLVLVVVGWKLLFKYENSHLRNALLRVYAFVFLLGTLIFLFQLDDPNINSTLVESLSGNAGLDGGRLYSHAADSHRWVCVAGRGVDRRVFHDRALSS